MQETLEHIHTHQNCKSEGAKHRKRDDELKNIKILTSNVYLRQLSGQKRSQFPLLERLCSQRRRRLVRSEQVTEPIDVGMMQYLKLFPKQTRSFQSFGE